MARRQQPRKFDDRIAEMKKRADRHSEKFSAVLREVAETVRDERAARASSYPIPATQTVFPSQPIRGALPSAAYQNQTDAMAFSGLTHGANYSHFQPQSVMGPHTGQAFRHPYMDPLMNDLHLHSQRPAVPNHLNAISNPHMMAFSSGHPLAADNSLGWPNQVSHHQFLLQQRREAMEQRLLSSRSHSNGALPGPRTQPSGNLLSHSHTLSCPNIRGPATALPSPQEDSELLDLLNLIEMPPTMGPTTPLLNTSLSTSAMSEMASRPAVSIGRAPRRHKSSSQLANIKSAPYKVAKTSTRSVPNVNDARSGFLPSGSLSTSRDQLLENTAGATVATTGATGNGINADLPNGILKMDAGVASSFGGGPNLSKLLDDMVPNSLALPASGTATPTLAEALSIPDLASLQVNDQGILQEALVDMSFPNITLDLPVSNMGTNPYFLHTGNMLSNAPGNAANFSGSLDN